MDAILISRSLLLLAVLLVAGACRSSRDSEPGVSTYTTLTPPIKLVDAMEINDGGTAYVQLRDANGKELVLCVKHSFDEMVPDGTLFLGGKYRTDAMARLPRSNQEAIAAVAALENAIRGTMPAELNEKIDEGDKPFAEVFMDAYNLDQYRAETIDDLRRVWAFIAWTMVRNRSEFDIYNPEKSIEPDWYAAFEKEKQEHLANSKAAQGKE